MATTTTTTTTTTECNPPTPAALPAPAIRELEGQAWYHGFRPKSDVVPLLKEVGDFLVRATNSNRRHLIVISVRAKKQKRLEIPDENEEEEKKEEQDVETENKPGDMETKDEKKDGKKSANKDEKKQAGADANGVCHLTVSWINGLWQLTLLKATKSGFQPPRFVTIFELVTYYQFHRTPLKICLGKAISRPEWYIKHETVTFDRNDILGSGHFCDVYKGIYHRSQTDKVRVAVKVWHAKAPEELEEDEARRQAWLEKLRKFKEKNGKKVEEVKPEDPKDRESKASKEARNQMISEAQIMSYYSHKNIIRLFGVCCDHLPVLIVMEYCAGGNLEQHLRKQGNNISTVEKMLYCLEAATGMRYLHGKKCIHRDLAARNCLISNAGFIKITDFGLSQMMPEEMKPEAAVNNLDKEKENPNEQSNDAKKKQALEAMMKAEVPLRWMAPESLSPPVQYSLKTDVWSFGVLIFEIFNNGESPWPTESIKTIAIHIKEGKMVSIPEKAPVELRAFVENKIWSLKPEARPDMNTICLNIHRLFSQMPQLPAARLTINSLPGVNRRVECLNDTVEAPQEKESAYDEISHRPAQTLPKGKPDAPTKLETQNTGENTTKMATVIDKMEKNKKKTSDRKKKPLPTPPAPQQAPMKKVPVADGMEKKKAPDKDKKSNTNRSKNKKRVGGGQTEGTVDGEMKKSSIETRDHVVKKHPRR